MSKTEMQERLIKPGEEQKTCKDCRFWSREGRTQMGTCLHESWNGCLHTNQDLIQCSKFEEQNLILIKKRKYETFEVKMKNGKIRKFYK